MGDFRYYRPKDLPDLLNAKLELGGRGVLLAGGSNVMVYIKEKSLREGTLLDIASLEALKGIASVNGSIEIGAAETMAALAVSPRIEKKLPLLHECVKIFANPLVRNRATLGGNLADASPIGDTIPPLLCLKAGLVLARRGGSRTVPIEEFFTGPGKNVLEPDEVLVKVQIPVPRKGTGAFLKLGLRKGTSCSVTSVALWLRVRNGKVDEIRIACGGVAPTPRRARQAEAAFLGQALDRQRIGELAQAVMEDLSPISDVRGSAEYRRLVTAQLLAKAVRRAAGIGEE